MTEYTARSAHSAHGSDSVARAHIIGSWVHIDSGDRESSASTALNPSDARTFARGILALADEVDGGEAATTSAGVRPLQVGDRVRVVGSAPGDRGRHVGDVGTLDIIDPDDPSLPYRVRLSGDSTRWCTEVERVDEPTDTPQPTPSPFARYVEEAKRLLTGTDHTGADVIVLARELHEAA
jgi:hypothetical protein